MKKIPKKVYLSEDLHFFLLRASEYFGIPQSQIIENLIEGAVLQKKFSIISLMLNDSDFVKVIETYRKEHAI